MLPSTHPGLGMGLPARLLPQWSLIHGMGRGGGELLVPAWPLCPLSGCQPYFTRLFLSVISPEGAWVSSKRGCYQQGCASRMSKAQTLEGAGTRGEGQFSFISDSNLSKKYPSLCHIFISPVSLWGTGRVALIALGCGEQRSEPGSSLLTLSRFLLAFHPPHPFVCHPSCICQHRPVRSAVPAASSLSVFFKCLQRYWSW